MFRGTWKAEWYHTQLRTFVYCTLAWSVSSRLGDDKLFIRPKQDIYAAFFVILLGLFDLILLFNCQDLSCELGMRKLKINKSYFEILGIFLNPGLFFIYFCLFKHRLPILQEIGMWKNVHPVNSAGIWTRNLWNMSLLPELLDKVSRWRNLGFLIMLSLWLKPFCFEWSELSCFDFSFKWCVSTQAPKHNIDGVKFFRPNFGNKWAIMTHL